MVIESLDKKDDQYEILTDGNSSLLDLDGQVFKLLQYPTFVYFDHTGRILRTLREIRVIAAPAWDSDSIEITLLFIRDDDESSPSETNSDEHLKQWLNLVRPEGRFTKIYGLVNTLDDLSARDYVESDPLDLDHISTNQ